MTTSFLGHKAILDGTGVVDGPGHRGRYWSYNQGTYLAGLVAYAELTGSPSDADEVAKVTEAILTRGGFVRNDGILIERLGTSGWDGCLFKGIMARHLRRTRDFLSARHLHPETVARIDRCLSETARAILTLDKGKDGLFPAEWHPGAKNQERNFNTHLSALIALVAALPGK